MMSSKPLPDVKKFLAEAVNNRGTSYAKRHPVILFYEDDNTGSELDAHTMRYCFINVFSINSTLVKIGRKNNWPAWTLRNKLEEAHKALRPESQDSRCLLIFTYIGLGSFDGVTSLRFTATDKLQCISWWWVSNGWFSEDESLGTTDTLGILDCYFSGAVRNMHDRTSQVISACGPDETCRSRIPSSTNFTNYSGRKVPSDWAWPAPRRLGINAQPIPRSTRRARSTQTDRRRPSLTRLAKWKTTLEAAESLSPSPSTTNPTSPNPLLTSSGLAWWENQFWTRKQVQNITPPQVRLFTFRYIC